MNINAIEEERLISFYFNLISVFTYCWHALYSRDLHAHRDIAVGVHQSVSRQITATVCENSVVIFSVRIFSVRDAGAIQTLGNPQDCHSQLVVESITRKKKTNIKIFE